MQRDSFSRRNFLRSMTLAGAACLFRPQIMMNRVWADEKKLRKASFVSDLFNESLVIDGIVNWRAKSLEAVPKSPGEIKRLTGINVGAQTVLVEQLAKFNRWIRAHRNAFTVIRTSKDITDARTSGRYGVIYYVQKPPAGTINMESLEQWKREGLRIFQMTYSESNALGGGCDDGDDDGLTPLGEEVVQNLNRLGMVVDVSHCGRQTTLDVCELSKYPVTANHANAEAVTEHQRNKSDEELKAVAATGGVVGAVTVGRFLRRGEDLMVGGGIDDLIAHIDYMVDLIGIDHVGLASDCWLDGIQVYEYDTTDKYLNSYARWKHVVRRLREMGYSKENLKKLLGLNFLRVYQKVWG
ncbi:membrane dipeptidase [bacterium]|nr:membrane dipeptidase [bacterium]